MTFILSAFIAAKPLEEAAGSAEQGELGRLWVELLKFYSDSGSYDAVISITGNTIALDSSEKKLTFEGRFCITTLKKIFVDRQISYSSAVLVC